VRTERIYVEEDVAKRFERLLVDRVRALRVAAPGADPSVSYDVGAVTFAGQLTVVERQIADATAKRRCASPTIRTSA
jgi:acyl-CoA reductase-like NAD-dependent aldehyde dehydrogenase